MPVGSGRKFGGRSRREPERERREKQEFEQQVLDLRRTTRVVAGGRRFSFRATVVIGDRKGRAGIGVGKGGDVAQAIEKGVSAAKKEILSIPLFEGRTIPQEVTAKFSAARVLLKPAREGKGLVAGGPVRMIAGLAGIKDMTAKILSRSANKLNNARATMKALATLKRKKEKGDTALQP